MSFASLVRTVRDSGRPDGYRVKALWDAITAFHPFGFHATRNHLAAVVGVRDGWWTTEQALRAVDVLARTRAAWCAHAQPGLRDARAAARGRPGGRGPSDGEMFVEWFVPWLSEPEHAELWGVARWGDCDTCGHLRALHGRHSCTACWVDGVGEPCRSPSPFDHDPPGLRRSWLDWLTPRQRAPRA